jgi:cardiolipin synthase
LDFVIRTLAVVGGIAILWWGYRALAPEFIDIPPDRITGDPADPPPAQSLSAHLGVPLVEGNRIELLVNGDEIFPAMLMAIENADESINLLSYIYWTGDIARRFAAALVRAARRGVEVRVVLDAVGAHRMDSALAQSMRDANVQIAWFNPIRWYSLSRFNHRTHRKIMVVDGRIGFAGGVGIGEEWTGNAQNPNEWRDDHFRLEGPVVRYLQGSFAENWRQATGEVLAGPRVFPPIDPVGDVLMSVINTGPGGATSEIAFSYWLTFRRARERIWVSTPYFAPDPDLELGLIDAARRGVDVRLLVPGEYQDSRMVRYASQTWYRELVTAGVKLYEFQPTMMHVKSVSVDGEWSMVGSANFDSRSLEINFETALAVFDRAFTEALDASFEADLLRAKEITLEDIEARPWFVELRNRAARLFREQL